MAFGDGLSWYPLAERTEWRNSYYNDLIDEIQSFYSGLLDGSDFTGNLVLSEPGQHLISLSSELWKPKKFFGQDDDDDGETDCWVNMATGWCDNDLKMGTTAHDSTTELQGAFTAMTNDSALLIPPGIYETDTGWTLADADQVHIRGFGASTVLKATADNLTLISMNAAATADLTIEDVTFDGGDYYGIGLLVTNGTRVRIKNCIFQNFNAGSGAGEDAVGLYVDWGDVGPSYDVIIENCKFIDCISSAASDGYGIRYYDDNATTKFRRHLITNCQFIGSTSASGNTYGIGFCTFNGIRISNCQFIDLTDGIHIDFDQDFGNAADGLSIQHCIFDNCDTTSINILLSELAAADSDCWIKRINISGNIFTIGATGSSVGVALNASTEGSGAPYERITETLCNENIFDNLSTAFFPHGLTDNSSYVTFVDSAFSNNTVYRAPSYGFRMHGPQGNGNVTRNVIMGNMIIATIYCMHFENSDCVQNIVVGNAIAGFEIVAITDAGTTTRKAHNATADLGGDI